MILWDCIKVIFFRIRNNPLDCDSFSKKKVEMSGLTTFQVKSAENVPKNVGLKNQS